MRVESCGPLFAEPKEGGIFFPNARLSEPITSIINPKNNNTLLVVGDENDNNFLKLDKASVIVGRREHPLPVGFFLTDEEWSLFRQQPDFGLVKPKSDTMSHLPNIHSPIALLSASSSEINQSQEPAPEFSTKKPQQMVGCEYSGTYSGTDDEFNNNNNNIVSKIYPFAAADLEFEQGNNVNASVPDEYATITPVQGDVAAQQELDDGIVRPLPLSSNSEHYDDEHGSNVSFNQDPSSVLHRSSFSNYFSEDENKCNPNLSISWNLGGNSVSVLRQLPSVGTIGSHPQPISSVSTAHGHRHHHSPPSLHLCNDPRQKFGKQAIRIPGQESWMDEYEQDSTQVDFEDWQSQSMFLSSEVDKAKQKWYQNQNNNNNNNCFMHSDPQQEHPQPQQLLQNSREEQRNINTTGRGADDMSTLITFLSKFDDKVAAIWGQHESRGGIGYAAAAGMPYSESYLSTCSTPVSCNMYPWASPIPDQNRQAPKNRYDIRAMQNQIEQQVLLASQFQQGYKDSHSHHGNGGLGGQEPTAPSSSNDSYSSVRRPSVSHYYHSSAPGVDPAVIMPPIAKNPLNHAIRKTFGIISCKESYRIVKAVDADSPVEEMESSLTQLSHNDGFSAFKRLFPPQWLCSLGDGIELKKNDDDGDPSELEINTMQEIFGSLDLMDDEDGLEDYNSEVNEILKSKPRTFYEQHFPPVDLLHSWTTHFTPIDIIEKINGFNYSSPPGILQPGHENDPNLPDYYTLFGGAEKEYNIFLRPAKTLFPIRFKLCPQPEKSVQTEPTNNLVSTPDAGVGDNQEASHHDSFSHLTVFDWTTFGYGNNNKEDYLSVSSGSRTPLEFKTTTMDNDNNVFEIKTTDWFLNGRELASGGGFEFDYRVDNGIAAAGGGFSHSDYCCDSGIGIDASSRAGFYDDLYPEYEGVEFDGGLALQPYSTVTSTDNDVDYGQFQSFPYNTWSTSSATGKTGKQNRRRTKGKPCKYFLADGSCKRGMHCKFSHDLTTCRYWAEGSCLKGEACPYLHCFLDGITFGEQKERRRAGKRYHLESDNDFPALGAFGNADNPANKMSSTLNVSQLSSLSSVLVDGAAGSSAEGEGGLLMLADPAGSMYDTYGFGFSLPTAAATCEEFPLPSQEQQHHQTVPFAKTDLKRSGNGRSTAGKSQSGSSWARQQGNKGSNNNNWISSMISVKEKRKKKKQ